MRIRESYLRRHPLCVLCLEQGKSVPALELDHVIPLAQGGQDIEANYQPLCTPHHMDKSIRERGDKAKRQVGLDGVPHGWK